MSDITLSSATSSNLLSLQSTTNLIGRTQERLATGLKVDSAIDDALAFFKARNLNSRASDLASIKDAINGGISVLTAAVQGLESIESVLKQMKALAQSAISAPESSTRAKLASQFNELRSQVDNLAEDASFNGVNLLKNLTGAFKARAAGASLFFVAPSARAEAAQSTASACAVVSAEPDRSWPGMGCTAFSDAPGAVRGATSPCPVRYACMKAVTAVPLSAPGVFSSSTI